MAKAVKQVQNTFHDLDETVILAILNNYSSNNAQPQEHKLRYGDAIIAQNQQKSIITSLTRQHRYKVAQKAKQSILSSLCIVNEQKELINRSYIYMI